ncbi:hypothetical protein B296_00023751 [Ensete ventricosum]|uniref:Uncharacterized protein n=1 Tax=Ensete ventricosum TaxID=4639 RepID=A0A426ZLW9_ENSVE|nr:hypothetical protein B296_00023751 [Ensete ventricosum]
MTVGSSYPQQASPHRHRLLLGLLPPFPCISFIGLLHRRSNHYPLPLEHLCLLLVEPPAPSPSSSVVPLPFAAATATHCRSPPARPCCYSRLPLLPNCKLSSHFCINLGRTLRSVQIAAVFT